MRDDPSKPPMEDTRPVARPMLTLDVIRVEHGRLFEMSETEALEVPEYLRDVRTFVDRLVVSGAFFDEAPERRLMQTYLDHWTSELSDHTSAAARSAIQRLELRPFAAAALRSLQGQFSNPFEQVAKEISAGAKLTSSTEVLKWLENKAKAAGLRFQEGLLKEIASQAAIDPEKSTLLEFCLWHLFEDPDTRFGNKICRPKGVVIFICTVYLLHTIERMRLAQQQPEQQSLVEAIARFTPGKSIDQSPDPTPVTVLLKGIGGGEFRLYARENLDFPTFLTAARLTFWTDDRKLRLVHRSLLTRWNVVVGARAAQVERARGMKRTGLVTIGLAAAIGLGLVVWTSYQIYATGEALRHAGQAAAFGAKATASVIAYRDAYENIPFAGGAAERKAAVAAAIYQGANADYTNQIRQAIMAVDWQWYDSVHARKSLNDGISGAIGFLATVGALGPLPRYASVIPRSQASEAEGGCESDYCIFDGVHGRPIPHVRGTQPVGAPVLNPDASGVAGVWRGPDGTSVYVFAISQGEVANDVEGLSLRQMHKVALAGDCGTPTVRFVGSAAVTIECTDGRTFFVDVQQAIPQAELVSNPLSAGMAPGSKVDRLKCDLQVGSVKEMGQEILPGGSATIFPTPAPAPGAGASRTFVTTGSEGYVRVWPGDRPGCPRAQFFSDFVRIVAVGSPIALAFHDSGNKNLFGIYHDQPSPVMRIMEQQNPNHAVQLVEHYPQFGLGRPVAQRFTRNGSCLEVQTRRRNPLTIPSEADHHYVRLTYYVIMEKAALLKVGKNLLQYLEIPAPTPDAVRDSNLATYRKAIRDECGV